MRRVAQSVLSPPPPRCDGLVLRSLRAFPPSPIDFVNLRQPRWETFGNVPGAPSSTFGDVRKSSERVGELRQHSESFGELRGNPMISPSQRNRVVSLQKIPSITRKTVVWGCLFFFFPPGFIKSRLFFFQVTGRSLTPFPLLPPSTDFSFQFRKFATFWGFGVEFLGFFFAQRYLDVEKHPVTRGNSLS